MLREIKHSGLLDTLTLKVRKWFQEIYLSRLSVIQSKNIIMGKDGHSKDC